MDCEQVGDQLLEALSTGEGSPWSGLVARHLEGCEACRGELERLDQTWALLGRWPEPAPGEEVRARLGRRVRRQLVKEAILTVSGWVPAVLAAAIGVALSLGLSLLIPYPFLVALCRRVFQVSDLNAVPYLVAGAAYGIPLVLGVWVLRKRVLAGAVIGSLEASVLFLVILAPYVIAQCREFAPALRVAFVLGLGVGAVLWSLAGLGLARLARVGAVPA